MYLVSARPAVMEEIISLVGAGEYYCALPDGAALIRARTDFPERLAAVLHSDRYGVVYVEYRSVTEVERGTQC